MSMSSLDQQGNYFTATASGSRAAPLPELVHGRPYEGSTSAFPTNPQKRFKQPFVSRRIPIDQLGIHTPWYKTSDGKGKLRKMHWTFVAASSLGFIVSAVLIV